MMGVVGKFDLQVSLFHRLGAVEIGGLGQEKMNYINKIYTTINQTTVYRG
jgi:hypothetical protein